MIYKFQTIQSIQKIITFDIQQDQDFDKLNKKKKILRANLEELELKLEVEEKNETEAQSCLDRI